MIRVLAFILAGIAVAVSGCGPNQRIINSAQENRASSTSGENSNVASAPNSFERELNAMRNADFKFVYVFRRRDGGVLDADDKKFVTETMPQEMNRRTLGDDGKALIIGSNFRMPAANLDAFKEWFVFEDHSAADFRDADSAGQKPAR